MNTDWFADAACRGADTRLFYPETPGGRPDPEVLEYCGSCPVADECLLWAMTRNEQGIWGGKNEQQRKNLRRRMGIRVDRPPQPINHGTESGARTHKRRGEKPCEDCRIAALTVRRERGFNRVGAS